MICSSGVATFDYQAGMWIEEAVTVEAAKECSWPESVSVLEDMPTIELLPAVPVTHWAGKLSVEYIQSFGFWV